MRTDTRVSPALCDMYRSCPRYFFASRSIWSSAPSSTSVAVPVIAIQRYSSPGSTTTSETRGSACEVARLGPRPRGVERDAVVVDVDPDDRRVRRAVGSEVGHDADVRVLEERPLAARELALTRSRPSGRSRRARARRLVGHRDHVLPVAQRVAQLLERDHLHVAADRLLGDRLEALLRRLLVQAVDDPGLGRDEEPLLRRRCAKLIIPSVERMCVLLVAERHALARAAALGMDEELRVRARPPASASMSCGRMPAWTWHSPIQIRSLRPVTFSSQSPRNMSGQEQDLACPRGSTR